MLIRSMAFNLPLVTSALISIALRDRCLYDTLKAVSMNDELGGREREKEESPSILLFTPNRISASIKIDTVNGWVGFFSVVKSSTG